MHLCDLKKRLYIAVILKIQAVFAGIIENMSFYEERK